MAQAMLHGHFPKEKKSPLSTGEVLALFNSDDTVDSIPFRPNGGQIFIFKPPSSIEKDDWKADGHRLVFIEIRFIFAQISSRIVPYFYHRFSVPYFLLTSFNFEVIFG